MSKHAEKRRRETKAPRIDELEALKAEVCEANRDLARLGLAPLTWGNASGILPDRSRIVIKPSGVPYADLRPEHMVVVALDGTVAAGQLRPSTDAPTHLALYRWFPAIGGIVHTHSPHATMFAQARREIPCLGTTHADHFAGAVPITRVLTPAEVARDYEAHTGQVIVERFTHLDPVAMPAILVAGHAPFTWGASVRKALENALALESIAEIALGTLTLDPQSPALESYILQKHRQRKHGTDAYYGQPQ